MSVTEQRKPGIANDQDSRRRAPESHKTRMVCCKLTPHLISITAVREKPKLTGIQDLGQVHPL